MRRRRSTSESRPAVSWARWSWGRTRSLSSQSAYPARTETGVGCDRNPGACTRASSRTIPINRSTAQGVGDFAIERAAPCHSAGSGERRFAIRASSRAWDHPSAAHQMRTPPARAARRLARIRGGLHTAFTVPEAGQRRQRNQATMHSRAGVAAEAMATAAAATVVACGDGGRCRCPSRCTCRCRCGCACRSRNRCRSGGGKTPGGPSRRRESVRRGNEADDSLPVL